MAGTSERETSLDALRGVAIALVVTFHYVGPSIPPERLAGPASWLATVTSLGWTGVDLFFVLSGYLIGGILIDNRRAANLFGVFYRRRAARILPLYLAAIGLALWWGGSQPHGWIALCYVLTFTQNFWMARHGAFGFGGLDVTWSLAVEEQFYLVAPLLIRLLPPRLLAGTLAGLIALAPALRGIIWLTDPPSQAWLAAYVLPWARMDGFALGVLLALWLRHPDSRRWLLARPWLPGAVALACGALALALVLAGHSWRGPLFSIVGFTLIVAAWTGVLLLVLTCRGRTWRRLFAGLAPLGLGAYSIYLFHVYAPRLLGQFAGGAVLGGTARFLLMVGFDLLIATILWNLVEKPFIALGHRARYRPAAALEAVGVRRRGAPRPEPSSIPSPAPYSFRRDAGG